MSLPSLVSLPFASFDLKELAQKFPAFLALYDCPQDPIHHAEGDVGIHTEMVLAALSTLQSLCQRSVVEQQVITCAALLHDLAKPLTTRVEPDGRVRADGHSRRGALMVRTWFYKEGVHPAAREHICALIRHHQVPFYLIERLDSRHLALSLSQSVRLDHLALVAEADARGRSCRDAERLLTNIALFVEYAQDQGCLLAPRLFPSNAGRFFYFHQEGKAHDPDYVPYGDPRLEVILLCGLPGSGKDTYVQSLRKDRPELEVISLDALREALDVDPREGQGEVIAAARDQAKVYLRKGRSFVWNATNLSRSLRRQLIQLFSDYGAHVKIVYREVPWQRLMTQNRRRDKAVPLQVIESMLGKLEPPDLTEAHEVEYLVDEV